MEIIVFVRSESLKVEFELFTTDMHVSLFLKLRQKI